MTTQRRNRPDPYTPAELARIRFCVRVNAGMFCPRDGCALELEALSEESTIGTPVRARCPRCGRSCEAEM